MLVVGKPDPIGMKPKDELAFLEQMLTDATTYKGNVARLREFQKLEIYAYTDALGTVDAPPEIKGVMESHRLLHTKLIRANAKLQEIAKRYNRGVPLPSGDPNTMFVFTNGLEELIGACHLAVEKELHPAPLHSRTIGAINRAYKAVFKTEKEQVAIRWIIISALAVGVLRLAGINIGQAIKYLIEIWRGKG